MSDLEVAIKLRASVEQFRSSINAAAADFGTSMTRISGSADQAGSRVDEAMQKLGIRRHDEIEAEIRTVEKAYQDLADSGELSERELAQASLKTQDKIRELRAETGGWTESLGKMKGELLAAGAALYGITSVLGGAAGKAAEFGTAMAEVSTLLDDTSGMDQLSESVRAMAREFGGDAKDQAKALYQIISAGASDAAQATDLLTSANKLAIGGVTDITTAADGLTSILNAYGDAAGGATNVSDAMFTAMKAGKTTIGELSAGIGQVAPMASQAGVGIEELLASVSALTKGGVATSEAMTQVRAILSAVVKPSSQASKAAQDLGIQFDVAAVRSKGLAGFLEEVAEKTGGNEEVMAQLFGRVEALQAVFALTGNAAGDFAAIMDDMANKAGATETAFGKMAETPEMASRRFKAAMADIQISLGQAVTALAPMLEGITAAINQFNELPGPVRTTAAALLFAGAAVPPLTMALGSLARALGILRAGFAMSSIAGFATSLGAATLATNAASVAMRGLGLAMRAIPAVLAITVAVYGAEKAAEWLASYSQAARDLADTEDRVRNAMLERQRAAMQTAEQTRQYADTVTLTAAEVARLSDEERARYIESLQGAQEYTRAMITVSVTAKELGANVGNALQEATARSAELRQALADVERGAALAAQQGRPFQEQAAALAASALAARQLANDLLAAASSGDEAAKNVEALVKAIDLTDPAQVEQVAQAMGMLSDDAAAAARVVGEELAAAIAKLDGTQLGKFSEAIAAAYEAGTLAAEELARLNDQVLVESFKRLGLSAHTELGRISPAAQQAIAALDSIRTAIGHASESGEVKMQALAAAIEKAVASADTLAAAEAIRERIEAMGTSGELAGAQLERAMLAAKGRIEDLTPGINSVEEAMKKLGITSQASLRQAADEAREAFEIIRGGGTTLEEQRQAWHKWAEAAVKSGDTSKIMLAEVEAGIYGTTDALGRLSGQQAVVGDATKDAAASLREQADNAAAARTNLEALAATADGAAASQNRLAGATRAANAAMESRSVAIGEMDIAFSEFMKGVRDADSYFRKMNEWAQMSAEERMSYSPAEQRRQKGDMSMMADGGRGRAGGGSAGIQAVRTVNVNIGGQSVRVIEGDDDKLITVLENARMIG